MCPENQIDTHREHTPFWLFSIITTTTTTLPLGLPFIHVSSERWGHWHWGITKNGECIKEELTYNGRYTNYYTSMSHFNGCHFKPYLGRRPSCSGQDKLPFSLVFLKWFDDRSFWWHGNRHWKHPLETRKKWMVMIFNVLLLFKTWIIYVCLYL